MPSPLPTSFPSPNGGGNANLLRLSLCCALAMLLPCSFGCGKGLLNDLSQIAQLRNQLIKEFHEQNINVGLQNSAALNITFVNSPFNERPPEERARRAQETALFIKRHYAGIDRLERMSVSFLRNETRMFIINYTQEIDSFVFGKDASLVGAPYEYDPQSAFKGEEDVHAIYNTSRNESEVRITRLQLEGDMDRGVMLSPHFIVRGDATTAGHAVGIPAAVVFNFASYAPEKIFNGDPPLRIVADGNTIFNDKARNLSSASAGGNEFLVQGVPLAQFLKMTEAKTVVLGLGHKEYLLSDRQLRALRDMANYANSGRQR